jgi:hypothetical protein
MHLLGGILNPERDESLYHYMIVSQKQLPPPAGEHHESGGGDEGLTRDFLDHRALS